MLLILENLGLHQYKVAFAQERINGSRLSRLDEDMLENDFGMSSRLHRMKLMGVIRQEEPFEPLIK